jgi:CIC family chloride channel protein
MRILRGVMVSILSGLGGRTRVLSTRMLQRLGLREESFLIVPAILIGMITAAAAVGFHELIQKIKDLLYNSSVTPEFLYGPGLPLLIVFPAAGGLVVGVISQYIARTREGHGIIDVIESVVRTSGFVRPAAAIEKIVTSAVTIGTGGSGGAEGPIVQIGAAIGSGVGQIFRFARHQMPIIIGCGSAAGISAIFNSPIGGVLFTLEVILQDFSIKAFTPLVVASVISNVTTRAIFALLGHADYPAIFAMPSTTSISGSAVIDPAQIPTFVLLGLICGIAGVTLTRSMSFFERRFAKLKKFGPLIPALGGVLVGLLGIVYVLVFGRLLLHTLKPFAFQQYPMPAFFADGYGVIHTLLTPDFYTSQAVHKILLLLAFLCVVKILATCLTLSSGGSGGIIAPSLFMGATAGGFLGALLRQTRWYQHLTPEIYALVGMGAVLAAVVHAPLSSIIILFELTSDYRVTLPAMLATVVATGTARLIFPDSIYTQSLRHRGIKWGSASDLSILRRMSVEQVSLAPATVLHPEDPAQRVFDLISQFGTVNFVVAQHDGTYLGMVVAEEINLALLQPDAIPLMIVKELMRSDVPIVKNTDDLATVFDTFSRLELSHLPVSVSYAPNKVIGLISRTALMRAYQEHLSLG